MDQKTIDTYNKHAEVYDDETSVFWGIFSSVFLDKFVKSSDSKILDVGSGPGRDGIVIRNANKDVTCIDASSAMIEMSTRLGLLSVQGNFLNMPFADEEFDGVWCYTSLLHAKKSEMPIAPKEIWRVLKTGGVLALGMIDGEGEGYRNNMGDGSSERWFAYYSKDELEKILTENGFEIIFYESIKPRSRIYHHFLAKKV